MKKIAVYIFSIITGILLINIKGASGLFTTYVDGWGQMSHYSLPSVTGIGCMVANHKYPNSTSRVELKNTVCHVYLTCSDNWLDCDKKLDNGCETKASEKNCGKCGVTCPAGTFCKKTGTVAYKCECPPATCRVQSGNNSQEGVMTLNAATGKCECLVTKCPNCYADCDKNPKNGCEVNICVDPNNYMGCGKKLDTKKDPNNCGQAGRKCASYQVCNNGVCGCKVQMAHGSKCDLPNANAIWDAGTCKCKIYKCIAGWADCDENPANGCEKKYTGAKKCN